MLFKRKHPTNRWSSEFFVSLCTLALATATLWIPFGLRTGGTVEEWLILDQFARGMSPFELGGHLLRPLVYLQFYLGFALTPSSFAGLNILHFLYIWGKGVALYLLLRELGLRSGFSLGVGLLFILYPADTGQMTLRTTAIQAHVMLFLVSAWLLFRVTRRMRVGVVLAMLATLTVSLLSYEAAYPLAAACPLLLLLFKDRRNKQTLLIAVAWYAVLGILATRFAMVFLSSKDSYQSGILSVGGETGWLPLIADQLGTAFARTLWIGWGEAISSLVEAPAGDLILAIFAAVGAALAIAFLDTKEAGDTRLRLPNQIYLVIAALIVIALGYAMYLPTTVRASTWRTFFLPSLGGGLLVATFLSLLCLLPALSRRRIAFAVLVGLITPLCVSHLLAQHRSFSVVSRNQQRLLAGILSSAPSISDDVRLILVFDESDQAISFDMFSNSRYFRAALAYIYSKAELNAHICYPFVDRRGELCNLGTERATVEHRDLGWLKAKLTWDAEYRNVLAFLLDERGAVILLRSIPEWFSLDHSVRGYDASLLIGPKDGAQPTRAGILKVEAVSALSDPELGEIHHPEFYMEFDENRYMGAGWGITRINPAGITYRFMPYYRAALHFPLDRLDYELNFLVANTISREMLGSLQLSIGGNLVPIKRDSMGVFRGEVPAHLVSASGDTTLIFQVDQQLLGQAQEERGPLVGLGFDWLRLTSRKLQ